MALPTPVRTASCPTGKAVLRPPNHETRTVALTLEHSLPRVVGVSRAAIVEFLHQLLADTVTLRDMYTLYR